MVLKHVIFLAGAAVVAPLAVLSEPAWPADFAQQESARRAAAAAECSSSAEETLLSYDTKSWTAGVLTGLGTAGAPFETRTFTWEEAACEWLKTNPAMGLLMLFR